MRAETMTQAICALAPGSSTAGRQQTPWFVGAEAYDVRMPTRVEQYDSGEVLYIAFDPDGVWAKSEFPDELLTVDYNAQGGVIGIEAIGSLARRGAAALLQAITDADALDDPDAVQRVLIRLGH